MLNVSYCGALQWSMDGLEPIFMAGYFSWTKTSDGYKLVLNKTVDLEVIKAKHVGKHIYLMFIVVIIVVVIVIVILYYLSDIVCADLNNIPVAFLFDGKAMAMKCTLMTNPGA